MKYPFCLISFFLLTFAVAQNTIPEVLEKLNTKSVPYITVEDLQAKENYTLLDAREPKEFNVSHIKDAVNVGFNKFNPKKITATFTDKNTTIIVYCSIGVRSEKIGEKLKKLGYKNVYNLYGGIFEWKNKGGIVIDNNNQTTDKVHTFNKEWSVYLEKGTKVYED